MIDMSLLRKEIKVYDFFILVIIIMCGRKNMFSESRDIFNLEVIKGTN